MSGTVHGHHDGIRITLPATSANLGPGFDAVGLALSLRLTVEASRSGRTRVTAAGRDEALCRKVEDNLILASYESTMREAKVDAVPLALSVDNEIPLGMGCGSSAAARLAGVALANHFGELEWGDHKIVAEASRLEGHPDNVAACWYGGFTVSVPDREGIATATFPCDGTWQLLLALPPEKVATEKARGVLPATYTRADAVFNVQRTALLTAAFAQGRLDLLKLAMRDRMHQPYRSVVCGLVTHLEQLQQAEEFAGVALSGAGPALLAILNESAPLLAAEERLRGLAGDVELLPLRIGGPAHTEPI